MRLVIVTGLLALSGCLDAPTFMKQSSQANLKTNDSQATRVVETEDNAGVVTAGIDPTSTLTQVIETSGESNIAGTRISLPPGAVAVATSLTVETGADLTGTAFEAEVGLSQGSLKAASATVVIDSSVSLNASQPFTVSILVPASSLRLVQDTQSLIVLFRYKDADTGKIFTGVIPTADIVFNNGAAEFKTAHFGAFQLAYTEKPIEKAVKIETKKEIVTAREVEAAPVTWSAVSASFDAASRTVKAQATPDGLVAIEACFLIVDANKERPWDQVAKATGASAAISLVWAGGAGSYFARIECSNAAGLTSASDWSMALQIPAVSSLKLNASSNSVGVGQTIALSAVGGTPPYVYLIERGGGTLSQTGAYKAPAAAGSVVLAVKDAAGQIARVTVSVALPPLMLPSPPSGIPAGQTFIVRPSGGVPPYAFAASSGSISTAGVFTAPYADVIVSITVTDSVGQKVSFGVPVNLPPLTLSPTDPDVLANGSFNFTASGGRPPYTFSMQGNYPSGSVTSSGVYTASAWGSTDTVRVTDANGNFVETQVFFRQQIYYNTVAVRVGDQVTIAPLGGKPPYSVTVTNNVGSINSSHVFSAPLLPGVANIDITDALGQKTTGTIDIRGPGGIDPSWRQSDYDIGYVTLVSPTVGNRNYMYGMTRDSSGRFVAAGMAFECCAPPRKYFTVSRVNTDGSADTTFGSGGGITVPYPVAGTGDDHAWANAVAVDGSGNIYAAGKAQSSGWVVMKFDSTGALVSAFGTGGAVSISFGTQPSTDEAFDIKIDSQGDLLVSGIGGGKPAVVKLDADNGSEVTGFGTSGRYIDTNSGSAKSMLVLSDDSVIFCGKISGNFALQRLTAAGALTNFANSSSVIGLGEAGECRSIVAGLDGKFFVAGYKYISSTDNDWAVGAYLDDGNFNSTFNGGSYQIMSYSSGSDIVSSLFFDASSHDLYVAGSSDEGTTTQGRGVALRLMSDGSLDTAFQMLNYRRLPTTSTAQNRFYSIVYVPGPKARVYVIDTMHSNAADGSRLLGVVP